MMKPEEFAQRFIQTAEQMGHALTPGGNVICDGGKNISPGKVQVLYKRYGEGCVGCASKDFSNDARGLRLFRSIAERALG